MPRKRWQQSRTVVAVGTNRPLRGPVGLTLVDGATELASVEVSVIGSLAVQLVGLQEPLASVGSRKVRTLLGLLSVQQGRIVSIDRIIDALWEGEPPHRPAQDTATLISRLRAVIGPESVIGSRAGGYRLGSGVRVDLWHAARLVQLAESHQDALTVTHAAGLALDFLDQGEVLSDRPDAVWAEPARASHFSLSRRARHCLATSALDVGDVQGARVVAEDALAADPLDEEACRIFMQASQVAGEPARALRAYERIRVLLAAELGIDPAAPTQALHLSILRNTSRRAG